MYRKNPLLLLFAADRYIDEVGSSRRSEVPSAGTRCGSNGDMAALRALVGMFEACSSNMVETHRGTGSLMNAE
jgi:hypothetical protein